MKTKTLPLTLAHTADSYVVIENEEPIVQFPTAKDAVDWLYDTGWQFMRMLAPELYLFEKQVEVEPEPLRHLRW